MQTNRCDIFVTLCSVSKWKRGGPGGLNKVCKVSPELQAVVGETAMSRTQVLSISLLDQKITLDLFPLTNFSHDPLLNT